MKFNFAVTLELKRGRHLAACILLMFSVLTASEGLRADILKTQGMRWMLEGLLASSCLQFDLRNPVWQIDPCLAASRSLVHHLDPSIQVNSSTRGFAAFAGSLVEIVKEQPDLATSLIRPRLGPFDDFSLWDHFVAILDTPEEALKWAAVLVQDSSDGDFINYLELEPDIGGPEARATAEALSLLEKRTLAVRWFPRSLNWVERARPYHFYTPAYLSFLLVKAGVSEPHHTLLPLLFNSIYEFSQIQEFVRNQGATMEGQGRASFHRLQANSLLGPLKGLFQDATLLHQRLSAKPQPFPLLPSLEGHVMDLYLGYAGVVFGSHLAIHGSIAGWDDSLDQYARFRQQISSNPVDYLHRLLAQ